MQEETEERSNQNENNKDSPETDVSENVENNVNINEYQHETRRTNKNGNFMSDDQIKKKEYLAALLSTPSEEPEPIYNNISKFQEMSDEELMDDMASTVGFKDICDEDIRFWAYNVSEENIRRDSIETVFKGDRYSQARTDCIINIVIKKL